MANTLANPESTLRKKNSPMKYVNIVITILLMFGVGFLPPFATLTPRGDEAAGHLCRRYLRLFHLRNRLALPARHGGASVSAATHHHERRHRLHAEPPRGVPGAHPVFSVAGAIVIYGFGKWFVRWSLSQKMFKGKPKFYTWCFMFIFMWSCLILNDLPLSLLLYAVWNDIADSCGYEENSTFGTTASAASWSPSCWAAAGSPTGAGC